MDNKAFEMQFDGKGKNDDKVFEENYLVFLRNYLTRAPDAYDTTNEKRTAPLATAVQLSLSWHKIKVTLKAEKKTSLSNCWKKNQGEKQEKHILKGVSGVVRPGELLAIMGASGAGKTTLMNVLTNRNQNRMDVEGEVRVNGRIVDKSFARHCSYVQQDDLFIGTLTVRELLTFYAILRMDQELTKAERQKKLDDVITELGLKNCENSRIGFPGVSGSISGGERKRLAFACEVLTNPSIMFCDEPTSGLDSFMAQSVVSVLRKLALGGRTIICTIHQPSSEVYAMFNNILLMAEGRVAYMGNTSGAIAFFEKLGLQIPHNYNPADFFVYNLAIVPGEEMESRQRVQRICDAFENENQIPTDDVLPASKNGLKNFEWQVTSTFKASILQQLKALMWRSTLTTVRNQRATWVRIISGTIISFILGMVYWQQNLNQKGIMNINGVIFLTMINISYTSLTPSIGAAALESPIFFRENKNGMYRTTLYFLCKTITEMPVNFVVTFLFVSISYWMTGLNNFHQGIDNYLIYYAIVALVSNCAHSFGFFLVCATNDINLSLSISTPITFCFVAFGGFFVNTGTIKPFIGWIKYISWIFYGNQALIINQWQTIQNISCPSIDSAMCTSNGESVIKSYNFDEDNFVLCVGMLAAIWFLFRLSAWIALILRANKFW